MISKNNFARITVDLPLDLQKKLKAVAALQGKSMREVVIESVEKELQSTKSITKKSINNLKL